MLNLSGEPSLGTLSLTKDGTRKYTYVLPTGMTFPEAASGTIVFTDRAGGEYPSSPIFAEPATSSSMTWILEPEFVNEVPAGANFEVFVNIEGYDYKVRYGRVVRREVSYPLNPLKSQIDEPPLMYEDTLQRSEVGPRWLMKNNRVAMNEPIGSPQYAMAGRTAVAASVLWYAPTRGDSVEMSVGLCGGGAGTTTIVLSSNYAMTSFLGVQFHEPGILGAGTAKIVSGKSWKNFTVQGSPYTTTVPNDGVIYTIRYSLPLDTLSVFEGSDTTNPVLEWSDISDLVRHGAGFRYAGAIFDGTLLTKGPQLYYWKLKDVV